ncbi:MAG: hypothetical protein U1E73_07685 [Planctomycetota bacterium]
MILMYVGMALGAVVGYFAAGPVGGAIALGIGALLGLMLAAARDAWIKVPAGTPVEHCQRAQLCVPKGQVADVTYVRDARNGRWLDVARCSLCTPEDEVGCEKRCLLLVRDS